MPLPAAAHTLRSPSPETPSAFRERQEKEKLRLLWVYPTLPSPYKGEACRKEFPLQRDGMNQRGVLTKGRHRKNCPCCQSRRKEGCLPPRAPVCRSRGLWGKVSSRELNCCQNSGGEGEGVRYADKPGGLSAHARTAVFAIGRAKTVTERGIYPRETNQTQSLWRTLGFPFPHEIYQLPQLFAKKICFAKIFCEKEERAFSAFRSALPNGRTLRSVPTTSV